MASSLSEVIESKKSARGLALIFSAGYVGTSALPGTKKDAEAMEKALSELGLHLP